jgi:hypothetical protein
MMFAWPRVTEAKVEEIWRLGVAESDITTGQLRSNYFYSAAESEPDVVINAFAPPATRKKVEAIHVLILDRTGSSGALTMQFEVRTLDGTWQRTISAGPLALSTAPTHRWIQVRLPNTSDIQPGEYVAVHVSKDVSGDVLVNAAMQIIVK